MRILFSTLPLLLLVLVACGPEPTISPYVPPDPRLTPLYLRVPAIADCYPGVLRDTEFVKAITAVNRVRGLHFLQSVVHFAPDREQPTGVALAAVANGGASAAPTLCAGADYVTWRENSVLTVDSLSASGPVITTEALIERLFTTGGTDVRTLLLDPFLPHVSLGRVDGVLTGGAGHSALGLKVRFSEVQNLHGSQVRYVAYPFELYPARLFDTTSEMFFQALVSVNTPDQRTADMERATVRVTRLGSEIPVTITQRRDSPNLLAWRASLRQGTRYWVRVDSVGINDVLQSFEYWVELQ